MHIIFGLIIVLHFDSLSPLFELLFVSLNVSIDANGTGNIVCSIISI